MIALAFLFVVSVVVLASFALGAKSVAIVVLSLLGAFAALIGAFVALIAHELRRPR